MTAASDRNSGVSIDQPLERAKRPFGGGAAAALALLPILLVASCGSTPTLTESSPSAIAGEASTTISGGLTEPGRAVTFTITGTAPDGSSESADLQIWPAQPATATPWDGWPTPAGCDVDPQRDALMPARVTITNTSSNGFESNVVFAINAQNHTTGPVVIQSETDFGGTPTCQTTPPFFVSSLQPIPAGQNIVKEFNFVLAGYFSPNQPSGDPHSVDRIPLSPALASQLVSYTVTSMTGPGLFYGVLPTFEHNYAFTLSGANAKAAIQGP